MELLNKSAIVAILPDWIFENNRIEKDFVFKDFNEAFSFMTRIALYCEKLNHHPDWSNVYNKVKIRLNTHSSDGVTEKDVELARLIDKIIIETVKEKS